MAVAEKEEGGAVALARYGKVPSVAVWQLL